MILATLAFAKGPVSNETAFGGLPAEPTCPAWPDRPSSWTPDHVAAAAPHAWTRVPLVATRPSLAPTRPLDGAPVFVSGRPHTLEWGASDGRRRILRLLDAWGQPRWEAVVGPHPKPKTETQTIVGDALYLSPREGPTVKVDFETGAVSALRLPAGSNGFVPSVPVPEGWLGNGDLQLLRGRDVDRCGFGTATWISSVTAGGHTWLLDSTREIHEWKGCATPARVGRVLAYYVRSLDFDGGLRAVLASGVSVALDTELRPVGAVPIARGDVVDISDDGAYAWMGGDDWGAGIGVARRETIRVTSRRHGDFVPGTHRVDIGAGEWADLDGRGGEIPIPWTGIDDDVHDPHYGYFPARCLGGGSDCPPRFDPARALAMQADAPGERCWFFQSWIESDTSEVDNVSIARWRLNQFGWGTEVAITSAFAPVRTTAGTLAVVGSTLVRLEDGRAEALPDGVKPRSFVGSPMGTTLAFTTDDALYIASVAGLGW